MEQYCCIKMEGVLEEHNSPLRYVPYTRSYYIEYPSLTQSSKNALTVAEKIHYCPWCGNKLPNSLKKEWSDIVKKNFGITDTLDQTQLKRIPEEFMSDEWWKKKNL